MRNIIAIILLLLNLNCIAQITDPIVKKAHKEIIAENYTNAVLLCDQAIKNNGVLEEAYAWKAYALIKMEYYIDAKKMLDLSIDLNKSYNFPRKLIEIVNQKLLEKGNDKVYIYENVYKEIKEETSFVDEFYIQNEIDTNIPIGNSKKEMSFALVIGNEKYQKEVNVKYAENDAEVFRKYLLKTLGFQERNIHILLNATYGEIIDEISWITNVMKVFNGEAKVVFYYAGHGIPDERSKSSYILPVDGSSSNPKTAISLDEIYSNLTKYTSKNVTVFLDACFSGSVRSNDISMLDEGRAVRIKPKDNMLIGNIVVFSATSGDETAFPIHEYKHGLFTYFLLKYLNETKGELKYSELAEYINKNVTQQSVIINNKMQNPEVKTSPDSRIVWKDWEF